MLRPCTHGEGGDQQVDRAERRRNEVDGESRERRGILQEKDYAFHRNSAHEERQPRQGAGRAPQEGEYVVDGPLDVELLERWRCDVFYKSSSGCDEAAEKGED